MFNIAIKWKYGRFTILFIIKLKDLRYKFLCYKTHFTQGTNARKVNCGRIYSAYILKPVLSGWNL